MKTIQRDDHLTQLVYERIEAMGVACSECEATPAKLLIFATVRGSNRRTHNGSFCSKKCHDRFHGLAPRPGKEANHE